MPLPGTRVNKARERAGSKDPALLITASDLLLGRLLQACGLLLRLVRSLASIFERHAAERFGPLLEEELVCFVAFLEDLEDLGSKLLVGVRLTLHALSQSPSDLLGYLVVRLAGGDPVLSRYPGALLGTLGVSLGDPSQVLEILPGHHGRGHFIDTSVGSGLVQLQIFTYHAPCAAKHGWPLCVSLLRSSKQLRRILLPRTPVNREKYALCAMRFPAASATLEAERPITKGARHGRPTGASGSPPLMATTGRSR